MQINPSSKMYKCIHATAINIKEKTKNKTATKFRTY